MLLLTSTSDKIQLITGAAGASIDVHSSFVDNAAGTITPDRLNVVGINTATTTDIVGSPAASTQRNVKGIYITNTSGVATQITVVHTDGTNVSDLYGVTLLVGENVILDDTGEWHHHDAQGAEYDPMMPNDYLYATGISGTIAETIPRILCNEANLSALSSGALYLVGIFLRAGQKINNISFFSATTAANTPTNGFFALYGSVSRNLLAQTENFTSEAWAANSIKTKALTSTYTVLSTGLYYVGIMITATTVPTLKGQTAKTGGQLAGTAPILHGNSTTSLTTSLPNPAVAISVTQSAAWAALT
jgi:hypothetical protein